MNPFDLSASDLLIWGIVLHLIADWPLQNDWMANNKMLRAGCPGKWWRRHPAAYAHGFIHFICLAFVFGWAAVYIAWVHLLIDTRVPVVWWSKFIKQTQPKRPVWAHPSEIDKTFVMTTYGDGAPFVDVGMEVRFWTDQVFHIICIAVAALLFA